MKLSKAIKVAIVGVFVATATSAYAGGNQPKNGCGALPDYDQLRSALIDAVAAENAAAAPGFSGLSLEMWGTIVDRDGVVCTVAYSGNDRGSQWPGSRVISAQKANTANAFSLDGLALSTANLYSAVQGTSAATPLGGSLYGLQFSNPVDPAVAYGGNPALAGSVNDPMVGKRAGGVNVFGGGLGLYNRSHKVVGAVGVSGDTSCRDHNIAWRVRNTLRLDNLTGVGGVSGDATHPDNIIFDKINGNGKGTTDGFEHAECPNTVSPLGLPAVR